MYAVFVVQTRKHYLFGLCTLVTRHGLYLLFYTTTETSSTYLVYVLLMAVVLTYTPLQAKWELGQAHMTL